MSEGATIEKRLLATPLVALSTLQAAASDGYGMSFYHECRRR